MVGYTVLSARWFAMLGSEYPNLNAYLDRLEQRPAFRAAIDT